MKTILLVDGFGIIFRSYYAFISHPLTNSFGDNVSAVFGFFRTFFSILNKINPDFCVIALEGEGKCFRKNIFPDYKANREAAPDDLKKQIDKIIDIIKKMHLPSISIDTYEADDVIGSLIYKINKENSAKVKVNIFSSDKDFQQLVKDNVVILKPGKIIGDDTEYDAKKIIEKVGIKPSQIIDYLALIGDSADNIPGVRGVGPKTAISMLQEWDNLQNIYKNIEFIKSKSVQKKLIDNKENAFLSYKLATIDCLIPIDLEWEKWKSQAIDLKNIEDVLKQDGLNSVIADIKKYNAKFDNNTDSLISYKSNEAKQESNIKYEFKLLYDLEEIEREILYILDFKKVVFDLETTGLDFFSDKIICMSLATDKKLFVIPYKISAEQQKSIPVSIDDSYRKNLIELLKKLFENKDVLKIGQNLKFDIKFLKQKGINFEGDLFDTMIAEYCLDASFNKLNMDDLAKKYFDYNTMKYKDIVKNTKKYTLLDVDLQILSKYSAQDSFVTFKLYEALSGELEKNDKSKKLFYDIEMPLLKILIDMELTGVNIDKEYLQELSAYFGNELDKLYSALIDEAGEEFNPNSPKQVAKILFEKFKLTPIKITKTGPSTDMEVLKKLSLINPIPKLIVKYRTIKKLQSTYSNSLIGMINDTENKIHTTYLQTGTQTGRLSSKNPNLQNIPVRTEEGRKIRRAFIPSEDSVLISSDYSQIELFLLAEFSKDPILYESFKSGEDIHMKTASIVFNKPAKDIVKEERAIAKTVNFGVLYGQSAFSLAEELGISRTEATSFINVFFDNYKGVKEYIESLKVTCEKTGYAETFWGRRRTIPEIYEKNKLKKSYGERMAVNTTIQGSAADLIKLCMIRIGDEFSKQNLNSKLIMQVHDELIFNVCNNELTLVTEIIKNKMERDYPFSLNLKTSIKVGAHWGEMY